MINSYKTITLLGRSGAGKDTQAELLVSGQGYKVIGSGHLIREFIKINLSTSNISNYFTAKLKSTIDNGNLAPTWFIQALWIEELLKANPEDKIIFDGSPRKLQEAEFMDEVLVWFDRAIVPILVDVSEQEAIKRLGERRYCKICGKFYSLRFQPDINKCPLDNGELYSRPDDNPAAIKKRMDYFVSEVTPILEYYKKQNRLIVVNGEQAVAEVYKELSSKLGYGI